MNHTIFKRSVTALVIVAMVVNPALAQQPVSKLIKQQEQQLRYASNIKIASAPVSTAKISSVQVDLAAEQARQAGIKQASNGTTVVDISAPTAGGVSHNLFSEFNVDNNGLILNNSAAPVLTQLGGWTDGNRRLAGGEASIILNEVTSNSRSNLFGHIEIAGRSAEFVLANSNGITCDGCGFINTPRVTLATGRAALQGGSLSGFNISGGDFRLDGKGLNAANVDRFDILARAASINAQLYARQLNVITGVNSVDYNTGAVAANGAAASPGFQIALDASSLGAMYANSIRLVGTEQGMGVNSQGLIQSVNDLQLSADGNIVIKNAQANNTIKLQSHSGSIETLGQVYAKSLQLDAKDTIDNHGLLGAVNGIGLTGESFIQRGNFYAGLGTDGQLNSAGYVQGKIADRLENYGTFYVGGEFSLESANLTNDQGQVIFQTAESLQLSGDFTNKGLLQFNTPNASVVATNIDNSSGQIQVAEGGSLGIIASEGFKNAQGVVKVDDELQVQAHTLDNSNGILSARDTVLTANQLVNNQGDVRAETLTATATSLQNQQGLLLATGAEADSLHVDVEGDLDNSAGTIFANADTRLNLGSLNNSQGNIQVSQGAGLHIHASNLIQNGGGNISANHLQLDAADLHNDTGTLLANGLTLDIAQLLSNSGQIQAQHINLSATDYLAQGGVLLAQGTAGNSLTLEVSNSIRNTQGSIIETAGESLKIDSQSLTNDNSQITVLGEGELNVRVGELNNQSGQLAANNSIAINAATVRNSDGTIHSRQLHLSTDRLDNTAGVVTGKDRLLINTDSLINNGGVLGTDADNVSLGLGTLDNRNGKILHAGQGVFSLTLNDLLNAGGSIQSNSNLIIGASTINNTSGTIAANQLTLNANQLDNSAGTLLGVNQLGVTASSLNNRSGSLQGRAVNVSAQSLNNQQGSITGSDSGLVISVTGDIYNQQGVINSGQQLSITTSSLDNNGGTVNGIDLVLNLDRLTNIAGLLQGGQIDLSVPQLDNTDGTISATSASGSGLRLNVSGDLNNTRGTVFAQGNAMTINAANVHNTRGKILYTGSGVASITGAVLNNNQGNIDSNGDLKLVATTLQNQQGLISAAGNAHIQASDLIDNSQGKLMAAGAQTLDSEQLINTNGIVSADQLAITSTHIDNLGTGFIEANKLILDTDRLLNEGHLLAAGNANNSLEFNVKTFINSGRLEANSENLLLDGVDMESMGGEIIHGGTGVLHIRHTGEFNNRDGILASQGTIRLDADSLDNRGGELLAEKQLQVSLSALNNQAGVIQTGDGLSLNLQDLDNSNGGKLIISGASPSELNIAAGLDNNNGSIIYWGTDRLQINAATIDNTNQGLIGGSGAILLAANQLDNTQGNLIGDSLLEVNATRLLNQDGRIESAQLAFNLDELHNSGSILARDTASDSLVINTQRLLNTGTIESRGINFTLANTGLDNTSGVILHRGNGTLAIEQLGLVNQGGLIQGAGDVRLNLDSLDNLGAGEIVAANNLQLNVQQLTNDGLLQAGNAITFNTRQLDNLAQGQVAALGDSLVLNIRAINNHGVLAAQRQLSLNSDQLDNGATGIIQSNGQLDVVVDSLVNSGFIAADQLGLNAQQLTNNASGRIQAASGLLQGNRWVNDGLVLIHGQHADSQVQLSELRNQGTVEIHNNNVDVTLGTLVNSGGEFISLGAGRLSLDALDIDNQHGLLAGRNLQLIANQLNNNAGEIIGDTLNLDAQVISNKTGHLQANAQLTLKADQLDNRNDGLVLSSGAGLSSLDVGYLDNRAGTLAINHLDLQATHIDNRAGELIADDLVLRAVALDNTQGAIATTANGSDDNLQITIANILENSQGLIQGGGKNSSITAGELRNSQGDIVHTGTGTLAINAGTLNNTDTGSIYAQHQLVLMGNNLVNENASISAGESLSITADILINRSGTLAAQNTLGIQANQFTNSTTALHGSALVSANWLQLTIDQLTNETDSRLEGDSVELRSTQFTNGGLLLVTGTADNSLNAQVQNLTNTGRLEAASNNLTLANSRITNSGELIHRGNGTLHIDQGELVNTGGLIDSTGQLRVDINRLDNTHGILVARAAQGMTLNAATLDNTRGLLTANELHINSTSLDNTLGEISGNNLNLESDQLLNTGGIVSAADLSIRAQTLTNNLASGVAGVIDADNATLVVDQLNNQARIQAQQLDLRGNQFNNNSGVLLARATTGNSLRLDFSAGISNQQGRIESHSDQLTISDTLDNTLGQVVLTGAGVLTLAEVDNTQGELLSNGNLVINDTHGQLNNTQGLVQALGDIQVQTHDVDNQQGSIAAGGQLAITAGQLNNQQGLLLAKSNGDNSLQLSIANVFDNTRGIIETHANNFSLTDPRFINTQGEIRHLGAGTFSINTTGDFTNADGLLLSRGNLDLAVNGDFTNQGQLVANQQLNIAAGRVNNQSGALMAATNAQITSVLVENAGRIQGDGLVFSGDQLTNQGGEILALGSTDNALQFSLRNLDNTAGGLIESHSHNLSLNNAINNQGGTLLHLGTGTLSLSDLLNRDGSVYSSGNLMVVQSLLDNRAGYLEAKGDVTIQTDSMDNRAGYLRADRHLQLQATDVDNSQGGRVQAVDGFSVVATGNINNDGGQLASLAQDMTVGAAQFSNNNGQLVHQGTGNLALDSGNVLRNNAGQISTQGQLTINTDRIENNAIGGVGALIKARDLSLAANSLQNRGGQLEATDRMTLTLPALDNEDGNILARGTGSNAFELNTASLSNRNGVVEVHSRDLDLSAVQLHNEQGVINHRGLGVLRIANNNAFNNNDGAVQSQGSIQLDVASIANRGGLLRADQLILSAQNNIDNGAGGTLAGNLIQLNANTISNNQGLIAAQGNNANALVLTTPNLIDNSRGVIRNGATNWSLQLDKFNNTGGSLVHLGSGILTLDSSGTLANTGTIASVADLHISAAGVNNQGNLVADKNLQLNATGTITNGGTGLIKAGNQLSAQANALVNQGEINSAGNTSLQVNQQFSNSGALVGQGNSTAITAGDINNSGTLAQSGTGELLLTAATINNNAGAIKSLSNLRFQANTINNSGVISAAGFSAAGFNQFNNSGQFESSSTWLSGNRLDNYGTFNASGSGADISLNNLYNAGTFYSGSYNQSFSGSFTNAGQFIHSGTGTLSLGNSGSVTLSGGSVSTAGAASLSGSLSGSGSLFAKSGIAIGGGSTFNNNGSYLYTQGNLTINSAVNNNGGSLIADGRFTVNTSGDINNNSGVMQGKELDFAARMLSNIGGTIVSTGSGSGSIVAGVIDNSGGGKIATTNSHFTVQANAGDINNQLGSIVKTGAGQLVLTSSGQLNNSGGIINSAQGQAVINTAGDLVNTNGASIIADSFGIGVQGSAAGLNNSGGTIAALGSATSNIESRYGLVNASGLIAVNSNNFVINAVGGINNSSGTISHFGLGSLSADYSTFANTGGVVRSNGAINWSTAGDFVNSGEISALTTLTIDANTITNAGTLGSRAGEVLLSAKGSWLVNEAAGSISGAQKVSINTLTLTNRGSIDSDNTVDLTLKTFGAVGNVSAGNLLSFNVQDSINIGAGERITSNGSLSIATQGDITNYGTLSTVKTLTLKAGSLWNMGAIMGGSEGISSITARSQITNTGRITSAKALTISANQYVNYGTTAAAGMLTLTTTADVANGLGNVLFSGGDMNINMSALSNRGTIFSLGNMGLTATHFINNDQARIESIGTMSLSANYINNNGLTPLETIATTPRKEEYLYSTKEEDCGSTLKFGCRVFSFTESTHYDYTSSGPEAVIAAGGSLSLNGNNSINNLYGVISTGGDLTVSGGSWTMTSAQDKTKTRTGTVVYVGTGPCSGCIDSPNDKGYSTVTTLDATSTPIGIVRVAGNISGSLAGSITQTVNGHSGGNHSENTNTGGATNTNGNRGNQANAASGGNNTVGTHSGSAANTGAQSLTQNGAVNGSGVNAGGIGGGAVGSVINLSAGNTSGAVGAAGVHNASAVVTVNANGSGTAIATQTGGTASDVDPTSLTAAVASSTVGGSLTSFTEDIDALKQRAFDALFGAPTSTDASTTSAPDDRASELDGAASNLAALDGFTPDSTGVATGALHTRETTTAGSTGSAPGASTDSLKPVAVTGTVEGISGSGKAVTGSDKTPQTTVVNVLPADFNPKNVGGLYVENKAPGSDVLIETRPEFTEYSNFLGSDYLLDAIGYNPDKTVKRLGDAFFENQLIRDALVRQTNTRFVGSATNDYDQMQALMNNAVAANQSLQLAVGVALTKEQAAALTSDIVWLVEKTVNGEKVLVPELYLASVDKASLLPNGAVMSAGGKMDLWSGNGISTNGLIAAGGLLSLGTLGNFDQKGIINSNTGVMLSAGKDFTNTGTVTGPMVGIFADGKITNQSNISATDFLSLTGDSITNTAGSKLQSGGWLNLTAQNDILNQQGLIEGKDVNLVSREGSIINRTEFTTFTSADGRNTSTSVGAASTILSHNSLRMDAGKDLDLQGSQFKAAQDITLKAGNDIKLDAITITSATDTSTRKVTNKTSETTHQVVSIEAGHRLTLDAGRDLNAEGTQFKAGGDASLSAGRDLNLSALANTSHSESIAKRKKVIDTQTTHTLVDLQSGGNVNLNAGQDANLIGTMVNAAGNVSLAATRDLNLSAVVDSDYHYDYTKKKKSFGRSKTTENETLDQTVTGGVINAGGNILVNSHVDSTGKLVTDESSTVNIFGGTLNAGGSVVVAADDDINITGMTYEELDFHRSKKSGVGGLSKKDKGAVEADTQLQNALIAAGGDARFLSGNNLTLAATDVIVDGNINLEAVDKLLITAGEVVNNSERWSKKSGIGSGGNLYGSKEHKSGEGITSGQESTLIAGGKITGKVGSGEVIGSDVIGAQGVKIVSDMGDIDINASRTVVNSYSHDKEMNVGFGDLAKGLTRPDQLIKNEDGRATIKLADAQYDKVDTKTTTTSMRGSTLTSNEDVTLVATAGSVNITGSTLTADADKNNSGTLGLAGATGVTVQEATDTYETQTKEVHGSAELSFVVQHQAAEVVKAVIAVDEAKDKLEQAKKDYKAYERNVSQLEDQLNQLESDYANKVPGVNYDDVLELRELVGDVKGDKEWYQAGVALAAINLTSATTALVQQTAAAAQSASTYGFNAGIQLDIDASKSNTKEKSTTAVASHLSGNQVLIQTGTMGEDGKLNTAGTSTTISGSHISATDRISVQTGDLNLLASKNTSESQSEQEHGHVTAQMTVYGASGGASITGSFDRSKESDRSTTHNNTTLTANNIDLTTSGDANIRGANVHANQQLDVDIAGNLNLESVQDRSNSRNTSMGVSGGASFGGSGDVSGVNGGLSGGNGMSVTRETVLTSLTSGGTANVNVGGHTQITGALLATINEDGSDRNQLDFSTGSLNFTDLRNIRQNTQTNAGVSANFGVGEKKEGTPNPREGQPTAEGANGKTLYANTSNLTYSNTQENSASKTLATLGHGNITVGGTQLETDGELTEAGKANGSPLIGMNRDTTGTEKELWNSEQSQTVDATLDHRLLTSDGRQQIKNDVTDTKEFGQDIGRAVGAVRQEEALGVTDFWRTLDNNTKATQLKNELTRNPAYKELMEGLKSQDGDTFAQSFAALGQMAQAKFGISPDQFSEIFLYSGNNTTSTSLGSTLFVDTKGGTVLDKNNAQYGNIFVNADGSVKTDMLNTLGHETVEAFTLRTDGKNDATQEAQANAFGTQFSDRINQAAGSGLDSTGGSTFNASLNNSYAVTQGTIKANAVGNAEVDNRKLNSQFAMGLPNYIAGKKAQGDLQGAQAAEVLLILGALAEKRGPTDNLNTEIDQLDASALGVSPESLEAAKLLPDAVKIRIVTAEPSDFCQGTACTIAAEAADSMVNLESMTDLAVEFVGGKLIDVGIDAYKVIKAGGKATDEVANTANAARDNLAGVRAEGDFGKLPPNQKYYEMQTTSGVVIKATEGKTTTVLGTYVGDTQNIINDQLILAKNADYTAANNGGFNILNAPDNMYKTPDQFWAEVNEPFLKAAVERGDEIYMATKPIDDVLNRKLPDGSLQRSGFGKEYDFLIKHGYRYDEKTGKMLKIN